MAHAVWNVNHHSVLVNREAGPASVAPSVLAPIADPPPASPAAPFRVEANRPSEHRRAGAGKRPRTVLKLLDLKAT
ncbi:hypothetical protein GCM10023079_44080 [Streptomyces chitinivorans]